MSKLQLKAALDSLQVKKPLRLPAKAPIFAAPASAPNPVPQVENPTQAIIPTTAQNQTQVGNQTGITNPAEVTHPTEVKNTTPVAKAEVQQETSVSEQAQVDLPTPVETKTKVGDSAQVHNQTVVAINTLVTNTTQVTDATPAQNPTSVGEQTEVHVESRCADDRATAMRRATEQDSSVVLEARAVDSLEKGYTRLPNTVLMKLASTDFTRNEIKLALLIARFTISFQRKHAPLSKTVLERRTGLRGPAVLEALSGLVAKGLVEKIQGDQHRPNQLGLVFPPDWDQPTKPGRETTETPVQKPTPVEKTSVGKPASTGDANQAGAGVGNPTNFKDIERYSKDTLSQLPENLRTYFEGLRLQRKRESEWQAFEELRKDFSVEDIVEGFVQVAVKSLPGGQPCHSPMAYLAVAMNEIMQTLNAKRAREKQWEQALAKAEEEGKRIIESEEQEKRAFEIRDAAFARFVGTRTESKVIAEICRKHGFPIETGNIGRGFAVAHWWNALSEKERLDLAAREAHA